ncbi:Gfo/Idh/MocA family protein [Marinomonas epiphytica]
MFNEESRAKKAIRWAMVGGGRGSQIGYAHRSSATRDGSFQLVAGAFDLDAERCREFGVNIGLDAERCYPDYQTMFSEEAKREDGIQAVSIATPNSTHYDIAKAALESGLHVVCEKPVTFTVAEAEDLKRISLENNRVFGVMYGYTGFQMIHQAREMIARGDIGDVRVINMQFAHGFHSEEVEKDNPGAKWRMNPAVSGPTYVLGDIGTHAFYLAQLMTGLDVDSLSCTRQSFVKSRAPLEDNAHVMMQFEGGAVGTLWASGVNAGSMHQQKIRIVGEKASIEWWDERPNQLSYEVQGEPARVLERGMGYLHNDDEAVSNDRIGGGHPEGFFESWANLYNRFGAAMEAADRQDQSALEAIWFPDIDAGIEGVRLLERCVESADNESKWVKYYD